MSAQESLPNLWWLWRRLLEIVEPEIRNLISSPPIVICCIYATLSEKSQPSYAVDGKSHPDLRSGTDIHLMPSFLVSSHQLHFNASLSLTNAISSVSWNIINNITEVQVLWLERGFFYHFVCLLFLFIRQQQNAIVIFFSLLEILISQINKEYCTFWKRLLRKYSFSFPLPCLILHYSA